ncbi:MAG: hypothetical protein KDB26_03200 [Microthrixaceae bacterium]|nr:hypothetical protein [Microthrixaceae bacterium]
MSTDPAATGESKPTPTRQRNEPIDRSVSAAGRGPKARSGQPIQGGGQRPEHPNGAAALLMIGVVVLLVLIAILSTFGGR